MHRLKVDTRDLRIGMYVVALDRSWLDSPFLFQGFPIKTEYELRQVRDCCEFVYIDVERGMDPRHPEPRKPSPPGDRKPGSQVARSGQSMDRASVVNLLREPKFSKALPVVHRLRRRAALFMNRLIDDVARGEPIDGPKTRAVVQELNSAVSLNVNAAMWLNLLRHEHEKTANHCVNVSVLALAFAAHLGYRGDTLEAIGMGGLLHDVGLIRVPKSILDKKETLTTSEIEQLHQHPMEGYKLLSPVAGIPAVTLDIIRHHHERVDGSGYPDGLSGDQIPREVLIVAVADMYDAMISDRPYAKPMSPHGTVSVMRRVSTQAFGTDLVNEFIRFIGIYPISTVVQLNNGALGMVVGHTPQNRLQPTLMMLIKPNGEAFRTYPLLNLSRPPEDCESDSWQIMRVVDPAEHGIDVGRATALYMEQISAPVTAS